MRLVLTSKSTHGKFIIRYVKVYINLSFPNSRIGYYGGAWLPTRQCIDRDPDAHILCLSMLRMFSVQAKRSLDYMRLIVISLQKLCSGCAANCLHKPPNADGYASEKYAPEKYAQDFAAVSEAFNVTQAVLVGW